MAIKMDYGFKPASISDVTAFEHSQGIWLPEEYKLFLLQYNGGCPKISRFKFAGAQAGSNIHAFHGLNGDPNADIRKTVETYRGRLPGRFLPIGADSCGNTICISVTGPDRGKIYFWDHEQEADPDQGESPDTVDNITLIADSFHKFLDGLY